MDILLVVVSALWFADNSEFVQTSNRQLDEGYKWVNVGKSKPSGTPAITVKSENGNEFIYYRLEK